MTGVSAVINDNRIVYQNYFVAYPDKKIAVVLVSNSDNFEAAAAKILDATIRGDKEPLEWFGYFDRQN